MATKQQGQKGTLHTFTSSVRETVMQKALSKTQPFIADRRDRIGREEARESDALRI